MKQQSDIRSIVRSIISEAPESRETTSAPEGFENEGLRNFFSSVRRLIDSTFESLYDEVQKEGRNLGKDSTWRSQAMQRGLNYMSNPSNIYTVFHGVISSDETCEVFRRDYLTAMDMFASKVAEHRRDVMDVSYESIGNFIAKLYKYVSNESVMKEDYYSMRRERKDKMLAQILKRVMRGCIKWPNGAQPSLNDSVFTIPITPNDSVSNAPARMDAGSVVGQAVADKVLSVVKQPTPDRKSQFSSFREPSVIPSRKESVVSKAPSRSSVIKDSTERRGSVIRGDRERRRESVVMESRHDSHPPVRKILVNHGVNTKAYTDDVTEPYSEDEF